MNLGRLSSAALLLSGVAGVVAPKSVGEALELTMPTARGISETRAGLGGTFAALGGWALVSSESAAETAVGVTWLGAAGVRLVSLALDRPRTTWTYWAYLGLEIGLGTTALLSAKSRREIPARGPGAS
ncbi:MAG: hypothetical protein JWQ81_3755 [Amycolatopsis sp.]|nr:hypothetical protein [Amycolatopsis sp.]